MRLFVAIEIAPEVVNAALELIDRLQTRCARVAPRARLTWVTADRLHVTVRFIGYVDEARAEAIRDALGRTSGVTPFELTVAGTGVFPPQGPPRVVWAGLTRGRDRLVELEKAVAHGLTQVGVALDHRPFNPHLTLARVREAAGLRAPALLAGLGEAVLGTTRVDAITLFESRLSPKGPSYATLQRTPLT